MQTYFSSYLPSLIYSLVAPIYLFFHLKDISPPIAVLLLVVSLLLLPLNSLFRRRIEEIRKTYWRSLDDMTGYYMDSLRGLTTLKLFDRDREHSRILGEKADMLNQNINRFMKINFTSFLVTETMIYAAIVAARCGMSLLGSPGDPWWRWSDCPDAGNAGASLSGGQRQKRGIARALVSHEDYMIFDEATSSVDPESEREIWETIGHLVHTRTLIISSHRMSTVHDEDCIYVMQKGAVEQYGSHEELMKHEGLYRKLVTRQQAMEEATV